MDNNETLSLFWLRNRMMPVLVLKKKETIKPNLWSKTTNKNIQINVSSMQMRVKSSQISDKENIPTNNWNRNEQVNELYVQKKLFLQIIIIFVMISSFPVFIEQSCHLLTRVNLCHQTSTMIPICLKILQVSHFHIHFFPNRN